MRRTDEELTIRAAELETMIAHLMITALFKLGEMYHK
jgi:hypothetical protein